MSLKDRNELQKQVARRLVDEPDTTNISVKDVNFMAGYLIGSICNQKGDHSLQLKQQIMDQLLDSRYQACDSYVLGQEIYAKFCCPEQLTQSEEFDKFEPRVTPSRSYAMSNSESL